MSNTINKMFDAGVHFGYNKSSRHSSVKDFIFGVKDGVQIIDLEKTAESLESAKKFLAELAPTGGKVIFCATKNESKSLAQSVAKDLGMFYVSNRWVGGTLTNFSQIKRRIQKMERMLDERDKGDFSKYTKKEQLLLDREINKLSKNYGGLSGMKELPKALVVVDPEYEVVAVKEALQLGIPVIAIANTDCDISVIDYPIVANDSTRKSIELLFSHLGESLKS